MTPCILDNKTKSIAMTNKFAGMLCVFLFLQCIAKAQKTVKQLEAKKITSSIKIDGVLDEPVWKDAPVADKFTTLRPAPFIPENPENATSIYFLYNNEGLYIGGNLKEKTKDSISSELTGRDGFGNNDFVGVIFDTYNDKLNGFEYFVTPLGEQMDAKQSPNNMGNSEDFSWNSVWKSASRINNDGWTFEMFLPYSAIRFGNKKVQNWGLNIVRKRQKSGQQLFWQSIDPTANGFLTQEGMLNGMQDIKPPMRLQFSPYFSTYINHYPYNQSDLKNTNTLLNGGMDVKYGLNQAFTLDMTLIPDFGQVVSDNRVLNLSPFEQKFDENRSFFTEGTELFGKGDLFYSRRIGNSAPIHYYDAYSNTNINERVIKNPAQSKLINATKISGRTQKGLGIGVLNALTRPQFALIENNLKVQRKFETDPLTNYNVFVLNQSLKHNSSISLVNTNVMRGGRDYDANVSSFLFDMNDKKNKWNAGGNISFSNLFGLEKKPVTGYAHSLNFSKTSGRFNFFLWQELSNSRYNKSDMGYFTNNNTMDQGLWMGYTWNKPRGWYNQLRINTNFFYSRLLTPIDVFRGKEMMYQGAGGNFNMNAQTRKLWHINMNINGRFNYTDFYESRVYGRIFQDKGRINYNMGWNSNFAKKVSWNGNVFAGMGGVFARKSIGLGLGGKIRFNTRVSIGLFANMENHYNSAGWAFNKYSGQGALNDTILFSRRNLINVSNSFNMKYSFTNRMGLTLMVRHNWSKVNPLQLFELNKYGNLVAPARQYNDNVKQNYNYFSTDMVYTWQFAQGSFLNLVWKDIGEMFNREFEKSYFDNFINTTKGPQNNSLSLKVIYFIDYLTVKNRAKKK
jgi:hypothetical protein